MTEGGLQYRVAELERRMAEIERHEPAVVAFQVKRLGDEVRSLKLAFYTFAFSVVASAIVFAFTTFALLGRHP